MECPKCAAPQADDRVDCSSCGVVFARYREARDRAFLTRRTLPQNAGIPDQGSVAVSRPLVIVALILVVAFGVIWTARRRGDRSKSDSNAAASAMLDDINQKGAKQRARLKEEADRVTAARGSTVLSRPAGFSEEDAVRILNQCPGFNTEGEVLIPKEYLDGLEATVDKQYPAFPIARTGKLVEIVPGVSAPGRSSVKFVDTAHFRMTIRERDFDWVIPIGRRRVTAIRDLTGSVDRAEARFEFTYEQREPAELLVRPYTNFTGSAEFVRKDGTWQAVRAVTGRPDHREVDAKNLCP